MISKRDSARVVFELISMPSIQGLAVACAFSCFAYESLRFAAFAAVSMAA